MWKRVLGIFALAFFLSVAAIIGFLALRPVKKNPAPALTVERTPERIQRGRYLFEHVNGCVDCHSIVDETRFGSPVVPAGYAKGRILPKEWGLPGTIVTPNLTSDSETGAATWTDGQLARAIREGIGHDERVLFPMMPYDNYRYLADEDLHALIAYIRTIPPTRNPLPKTEVSFPVNLLIRTAPQPVGSIPMPDRANPVAYGEYLTNVAGCRFCHTQAKNGELVKGMEFAGGQEFLLAPGARAVSANLTPDPETGTGRWSEKEFLDKFNQYKDYAANGSPKIEPVLNTAMPWLLYTGMETSDLRAIFAYLKSLPARKNAVVTHPDAPEEKRLKQKGTL